MLRKAFLIVCIAVAATWILYLKNQHQHRNASAIIKNQVPVAQEIQSPARGISSQTETQKYTNPQATLTAHFLKENFDFSKYSPSTQAKIKTLSEILTSKNDNDPRLDQDLKNLSPEDKAALKDFYQDLKSESLNERGTVAFLMGRDLKTPDDVDFLTDVLSEPPCLSMDNCAVHGVTKETHLNSIEQVSLSYPQQVAIESLRNLVTKHEKDLDSDMKQHIHNAVEQAKQSPVLSIREKAKDLSRL